LGADDSRVLSWKNPRDREASVEAMNTATAHHDWDRRWRTEEGRGKWLTPEEDVREVAAALRASGMRRAIDLGCGVGRHAIHLASLGFSVAALDGSQNGVAIARQRAQEAGQPIEVLLGLMTELPFRQGQADYLLAWNVIYHGSGSVVQRCLEEIRRVLRPGGVFQGTMLSKRNRHYGQGREVAADTFILDGVSDKQHPHFYCNADELTGLLRGFRLRSLTEWDHNQNGSYHWHLVAERR
jgi:SAM-dependent methyltransferase